MSDWRFWIIPGLAVLAVIVAAARNLAGFPCPTCRQRFSELEHLDWHREHVCGRLVKRRQDV